MEDSRDNYSGRVNNLRNKLSDCDEYLNHLKQLINDSTALLNETDKLKEESYSTLMNEIEDSFAFFEKEVLTLKQNIKDHNKEQRKKGLIIQNEVNEIKRTHVEQYRRLDNIMKRINDAELMIGQDVK